MDTHTYLDLLLRPRAPAMEAHLGRELVDDEAALPRRAVRLAVDEALAGAHGWARATASASAAASAPPPPPAPLSPKCTAPTTVHPSV